MTDCPASQAVENYDAVRGALRETGLLMIGINTRCGGGIASLGFAAFVGREKEAQAAIGEALEWAARFGVHLRWRDTT